MESLGWNCFIECADDSRLEWSNKSAMKFLKSKITPTETENKSLKFNGIYILKKTKQMIVALEKKKA